MNFNKVMLGVVLILLAIFVIDRVNGATPTKEDYLRAQLKSANAGIKYQSLIMQTRLAEQELIEANSIVIKLTSELGKTCKNTEQFNSSTVACEAKPSDKPVVENKK